ncbi:MAG TPA: hypothetical protein VH274_06370 [Mycobacteriales bacterium]|nr:hypothetical protein [Mycobacteriales bacterium]
MSHLRLVPAPADDVAEVDDLPRISLRLLMAASGRCSCDDCLWAYRRGNKDAGNVRIGCRSSQLIAVR